MNIEVKTVKLTKSKIQQMDYIGIPKNPNAEVLGWVNMDKKKWVIVKSNDNYYRAEFITKIEKELKAFWHSLSDDGTVNYCVKYRYIPRWWRVCPIERMIVNQITVNARKDISWYELKFEICKLLEIYAVIPDAMGNKWEPDFIYIDSVKVVDKYCVE